MEKEVFGVIYERFSVGRKLSSFGVKHDIKTVLEMPAHGAKAMPSIYSLGFGMCAQKITLVNGNPKYISEWKKIGAAHKIEWEITVRLLVLPEHLPASRARLPELQHLTLQSI